MNELNKKNIKNYSLFSLFLFFLFFNVSCDHSNSRKMTPPELRDNSGYAEGEVTTLKISNEVDILFVVDNSESMKDHQANLSKNIYKLVNSIEENKSLDYHIGITSVFDSRYGNEIKDFNPNGFLIPLKGTINGLPNQYYTRNHNNLDLLAKSLLIGVLPLKDQKGNYQGPEHEESLSPIYSAFTEPALSSPSNQGFFRPEARLAIIIITDADDSSPNLSGSDLDTFLRKLKNSPDGTKISTFGILSTNRLDKDRNRICSKVDPGLVTEDPVNILNFIYATRGSVFSLCKEKSMNSVLEIIGNSIQNHTEKHTIHLNDIPEFGTIKVYLASQNHKDDDSLCVDGQSSKCKENNLNRTDITDWSFDSVKNIVIINSIPKGTPKENNIIKVKYTKVTMGNVKNGRAKRF